jgi:hypothetical protein
VPITHELAFISSIVLSEITHDDSVIPGKYGELIQSSNQIPPGSNVASYEDPKGEDREGVHESAAIVRTLLSLGFALGTSMAGGTRLACSGGNVIRRLTASC